jgi:hypothetical protein
MTQEIIIEVGKPSAITGVNSGNIETFSACLPGAMWPCATSRPSLGHCQKGAGRVGALTALVSQSTESNQAQVVSCTAGC